MARTRAGGNRAIKRETQSNRGGRKGKKTREDRMDARGGSER